MIHDFDIGHERFSFDTYNGIPCGPGLLKRTARPPERYFTFNTAAALPMPCLQTDRRAGVAVIIAGLDSRPLEDNPYLVSRRLAPAVRHQEATS